MAASQSAIRHVASRYADAAFSHALEAKKEEDVCAELKMFCAAIAADATLKKLVKNPSLSANHKAGALVALAQASGGIDTTIDIIRFVALADRAEILPELADLFETKLIAHRDEIKANVTTATPLKKDVLIKVEKALAGALGKPVQVDAKADSSLIGGMRIAIGSRMLDHSVKGKLQRIRAQLSAVPLG